MSTFEPGATVFTEDGARAEYLGAVDGVHAIRLVRIDEEECEFLGNPRVVHRVFRKPPRQALDAEIVRLDGEIQRRRDELSALQTEIGEATKGRRDTLARLKEHVALKHIDDFVAGRLTHFVVLDHSGIAVKPAAEALTTKEEDRYNKKLRLLTLYGATGGELQWRLHQYSDGSGINNYSEVYPFPSEAEAIDWARGMLDHLFAEAMAGNGDWRNRLADLAASARKIGMTLPPEVAERVRAGRIGAHERVVDERRKQWADAEAALAKARGEQP